MNKHTAFARISLLFASILGSINIASGDWFITDGEIDNASASVSIPANSSQSGKAVCYIKETGIYYTSLDKALDVAEGNSIADTICVIPNLGFDVTIAKSHTIKSVDALLLPYLCEGLYIAGGRNVNAGTGVGTKVFNYDIIYGKAATFADKDADSVKKYRQTKVVLGNGKSTVKLTVNGKLCIGGQYAHPGQGVSGQTAGYYCEMNLLNYASIVCDGSGASVECDGYIKRSKKSNNNTLYVQNGGKLISPLVVYDYKGGSWTYAVAKAGTISPFYVFDFPNLQVTTTIKYGSGSCWQGKVALYIDVIKSYAAFDANFIAASDSVLIQKSGSITIDYVPANENGFTSAENDGTKTSISVDGAVDLGGLSFEFSLSTDTAKADSNNFFFPISYRLSLLLNEDSVFNASKKIKLMNGSSLSIAKGATLNLSAPLAIYDSTFVDGTLTGSDYPDNKSNPIPYPSGLADASLINNGTIDVTGDGAIGGFVATSAEDSSAILNYGTKNYTVDSPEANIFTGERKEATIATKSFSLGPTAKVSSDSGESFTSDASITYNSYFSVYKNATSGFGWRLCTVADAKVSATPVGSGDQDKDSGWIQAKVEIEPKYISNVTYKWTLVDAPDCISLDPASGEGETITIKNTSENDLNVKVIVTATANGIQKSSEETTITVKGKVVEGKTPVDIMGFTLNVKDTGWKTKKSSVYVPSTESAKGGSFELEVVANPVGWNSTIIKCEWGVYTNAAYTTKATNVTLATKNTKEDKGINMGATLTVPAKSGTNSQFYYIKATITYTNLSGEPQIEDPTCSAIVAAAVKNKAVSTE